MQAKAKLPDLILRFYLVQFNKLSTCFTFHNNLVLAASYDPTVVGLIFLVMFKLFGLYIYRILQ